MKLDVGFTHKITLKQYQKAKKERNMTLSVSSNQICDFLKTKGLPFEFVAANDAASTVITHIAAIEDAKPGTLVCIDKKEYVPVALEKKPSILVAPQNLKEALGANLNVILTPNVALAHALIKYEFARRDYTQADWGSGIANKNQSHHPSAVIHETAKIGEGTRIEPRAIIGKNARIGKNSHISAGAVIEHDVTIGDNSIIHPNAVIGYNCIIGNQTEIGSGTVIGSEGFGYAQDQKRKSYPIPQTGNVVIEDRVRIGSNCSIDRATYHSTRIGAGTKIDNLCHVAHNVQIGQDCLLTSMFCVAGSTKIGDRVMASGQTGVLDHLNISNDVALVHKAGVSKDISEPGVYAGTPTQPLSEYMRNTAISRNLTELKKRIAALESVNKK
jgi:UDP-3-O-[3-hydroxymyristoyl] glucosamine N-acyltransferase